MAQEGSGYVKKETMLLVALAALVTGFLGGIVFSVYKSPAPPITAQGPSLPQQQAPQQQGFSQDQADRILALEKEVATNPGNREAWTLLGNIWFDTNKYDKAIKAYSKALELDPNDANVWTDLGVMYRRNSQPDKALEAFEKAIAVDPRHEVSRFNKGIVLLHDKNDMEGAIKAWEELVQINPSAMAPSGQPIREMIEELRKRTGDAKKGFFRFLRS